MTIEILEGIPVAIDKQEILRIQGHHKNEKPSAAIQEILEKAMEDFHPLLQPKATFIEMEARVTKESINLENGLVLHNPDGAKTLIILLQLYAPSVQSWARGSQSSPLREPIPLLWCSIASALRQSRA